MTRADWLIRIALIGSLAGCGQEQDAGTSADRPVPSSPETAPPRPGRSTVTLITGHRVTVDQHGGVAIESTGTGAAEVHRYRHDGHLFVIPLDAAPLVASGRLDRRLFDVTELVRLEYDDAHRADLPLIVTYDAGAPTARAALARLGVTATRPLRSVDGEAIRARKDAAAPLWSAITGRAASSTLTAGIRAVWLDGKADYILDHSAAQIGAPAAWAAGITGAGVTVAVLDSGIKLDHPDFAGRIVGTRNVMDGTDDVTDNIGHGTHVASILAGSGAGEDGRYRGIAPEASLLIGKVCDFGCFESDIVAGMEWAAESGAAVVNLSLGGPDSPGIDVMEEAVNRLTAETGTLFVAGAGNAGNCGGANALQLASPSTADAAVSVGAVGPTDLLAGFSCRGPRAGDGAIKPDITAPGSSIVAARAPGTFLGDLDPVDELYTHMSGTSMATPHVSGTAALLVQQHPDWRADQLKSALMGSARDGADAGIFEEGAGRVDVPAALATEVLASPPSLSLGFAAWPHEDDEPVLRTVTYRNTGPAPATVQLAFDIQGPGGAPAAPGMFTVEPAELTLPPGGQADVTVTVDTRAAGPDGRYTGTLVATAGDARVRTLVAIDKEVESYDLGLELLDREGAAATARVQALALDTGELRDLTGETRARFRRASYHIEAIIEGVGADGRGYTAVVVQPLLEVTGPTTLRIDARAAAPIAIRVPEPGASRALENVNTLRTTAAVRFESAYDYLGTMDPDGSFGAIYTAHLGPAVPAEEFSTVLQSVWARPAPPVDGNRFVDSPYQYTLDFFPEPGRLPTGFTHQVTRAELATLTADYATEAPTFQGQVTHAPVPRIDAPQLIGVPIGFSLPTTRSESFTAAKEDWRSTFEQVDRGLLPMTSLETAAPVTYEAGQHRRAHWNQAVLGPTLSFPGSPRTAVGREGNEIAVFLLSLYSDQAGHIGSSGLEFGHTRLFRDGALLDEIDLVGGWFFPVPPEAATYRLEVESIRDIPTLLSTQVDVAWTFRSGEPPGGAFADIPVMAVRFEPRLDADNTAPAGLPFVVPVRLSRQLGATAPLRRLTVEVSYDGGGTWASAMVLRVGDQGVAVLNHPARAAGVSLRATAVDRDGNAVEQTILDGYRLRERTR